MPGLKFCCNQMKEAIFIYRKLIQIIETHKTLASITGPFLQIDKGMHKNNGYYYLVGLRIP